LVSIAGSVPTLEAPDAGLDRLLRPGPPARSTGLVSPGRPRQRRRAPGAAVSAQGALAEYSASRVPQADRILLAAASRILPGERWRAFVVTPRTLLRWHRELVRHRWTFRHPGPGRPPLARETVELILRLAKDNPRWGYLRIRGELLKLGVRVSATSIRTVLRRHGLGPAPRRSVSGSKMSTRVTPPSNGPHDEPAQNIAAVDLLPGQDLRVQAGIGRVEGRGSDAVSPSCCAPCTRRSRAANGACRR